MAWIGRCLIGFLIFSVSVVPLKASVALSESGGMVTMENDALRITLNPLKGGRIDGYQIKSTGEQLLGEGRCLLIDHFWQQLWPGEFMAAPYELKVVKNTAEESAVELACVSRGWNSSTAQKDIRIVKRITMKGNSPKLQVSIKLENVGSESRLAGYWCQNILYAGGRKNEKQLYFRPTVRGVSVASYECAGDLKSIDELGSPDGFVRDPQNAWMGTLGAGGGTGLAFVMKYDELMYLYNCVGAFTTEWQYNTTAIPAGKFWTTEFEFYPVSGLPRLSYASTNFAAAVIPGDTNGKLTVTVYLAAADAKLKQIKVGGSVVLLRTEERTKVELAEQTIAELTAKPARLTFAVPHDPQEPVAIQLNAQAESGAQTIRESFETYYGAMYGYNRKVDYTPLYPICPPERHVTILKPDKIVKKKNTTPRVLIFKGMFADAYQPDAVSRMTPAEVTTSYLAVSGTFPPKLSYFPASYDEIMAFDVIWLLNIPGKALWDFGEEMLKDFVMHGGILVYGGDLWAYGRGNLGERLPDILPVAWSKGEAVADLGYIVGQPVSVCDKSGNPVSLLAPESVNAYLPNAVELKKGAKVLLSCEAGPILAEQHTGKGRVLAITGSALGEPPKGKKLFTDTNQWTKFMSDMLNSLLSQ